VLQPTKSPEPAPLLQVGTSAGVLSAFGVATTKKHAGKAVREGLPPFRGKNWPVFGLVIVKGQWEGSSHSME